MLGMVAPLCNPSTQEAEARSLQVTERNSLLIRTDLKSLKFRKQKIRVESLYLVDVGRLGESGNCTGLRT